MPTIMLMSPKGGAGKSTMTIILAGEISRHGKSVTIIDADPNFPIHDWKHKGRSPDNIQVLTDHDREGQTIEDLIDQAQAQSDVVIVDTEGTQNIRVELAALKSDLILLPFNPSPLDMKETGKAIAYLKNLSSEVPIRYMAAPTRLAAVGNNSNTNALLEMAEQGGFPILKNRLMAREAYKDVFNFGATLHTLTNKDTSGLDKARNNASEFATEVITILNSPMTQSKVA